MSNKLVVLVLLVLGCDASDPSAPGPDAAVPHDAAVDAAAPGVVESGDWYYASYSTTTDTCGNLVEGDDQFVIDMVTATSFRKQWPESTTPPSSCTVGTSQFFNCTTPDVVQDRRPAKDAVLTGKLSLSGHITTTRLASGTQSITITCTGTQCSELGVPCSVVATVALAKR